MPNPFPIPRLRPGPLAVAVVCLLAATAPAHAVAGTTPLVVGGGDTYEPFHFVDEDGPTGFDVELLRAVARVMGLELDIRLGPWQEARAGLAAGTVDIQAGMTFSHERSRRYAFSTPTLRQHYRIFVRGDGDGIRDERDLAGRRIIVQRDGVMEHYVGTRGYTDAPLRASSAREALRMLAAGDGDCALLSEYRGLFVARRLGLADVRRVGDPVHRTVYAFAVPRARADLVPVLNQGLAIVKASGEYDRLYDRWFGVLEPRHLSTWDYVRYAGWIVVPLLVGFLVATLWSWMLQRQVMRQTAALRAARDEARAASEAKSRFLAVMSHEIRTPLNGVLGMTELLLATDLDGRQQEQATTIRKSAAALQGIVGDILEFSKIEAGDWSAADEPFAPDALFRDALAIVSPSARTRGLDVRLDVAPGLPAWLRGDPAALRQVLLHLLGNAVKFTHEGHVRLTVAHEPRDDGRVRLRVQVEDTGVGVDEAGRDALFEPFTQADSSSTRRYGGTGLGLAITRQLVLLMGGAIGHRPRPGGGSVFAFHLDLPRAEAPAGAGAADAAAGAPDRAEDLPVLIVEDNPINQRVLALMLEGWGLTCEVAANGREAVEACARRRYGAVLMDYQMPEMDGIEATRAIRAREAPPVRTPIVALTAGAVTTDRDRCLAAGMDDYLTKPVDGEQLKRILERCLGAVGGVPSGV